VVAISILNEAERRQELGRLDQLFRILEAGKKNNESQDEKPAEKVITLSSKG
jgi:hypothetical protein